MKKLILSAVVVSLSVAANATVLLQVDATPAQVNTLPAGLTGSFDSGTDVKVVTLATMQPAIGADHTGGDGHVLRVGDIDAGGGSFNWAYVTTPPVNTDVAISAYYYVDFTNGMDTPTVQERDYVLMARTATADPQGTSPSRSGYFFLISANASWTGVTPNPVNRKPYIIKRNADTTYTQIGINGVADVTDGWHKLKLEVIGTSIKGYVDDVVVCSGTDSTYTGTGVAWGYYDDNGAAALPTPLPYAAAVDNLLYETATLPPPTAATTWEVYD
ncbi:hypothetical protein BH09SUM1_BH09SUM1_13050 [soil metagenome]